MPQHHAQEKSNNKETPWQTFKLNTKGIHVRLIARKCMP